MNLLGRARTSAAVVFWMGWKCLRQSRGEMGFCEEKWPVGCLRMLLISCAF